VLIFLVLIVQAAWLWICYVTFTKDYTQNWTKMLMVVIAATIPGMLIGLASLGIEGSELNPFIYITGNILRYVIIYLSMAFLFRINESKIVLKIIALNYAGRAIVHLVT
jgi:hypothetical protein